MHGFEQALRSALLSDLWLSKEAAVLQQKEGFANLNSQLQAFVRRFDQDWEQLSDLIQSQTTDIREAIIADGDRTRALVVARRSAQATAA
ncbi:hypothetical protein N657DRAFT_42815 [Parathielavia appendiculata]|uniref:Uncharacterized protein n=1 Tax=Parathielavia appendiculata TaxID=2587402 RepID=A0AAN6U9V4_9PEZI|nr:hypothetical protein N657DRAFT_42815 [Parathielavia appendiculata]